MKKIKDLNFGFNDAENYKRKENKDLFNSIFVKNKYLDRLLLPCNYFLVGEKGTGKTAYAVFLSNNEYKNTVSELKYIRETDYQKFVTLKKEKHLQLSDYSNIWKVIILLLFAKSLKREELDYFAYNKGLKMKSLLDAIDEYYNCAFSPEIVYALDFVENSKVAAELITNHLSVGGEKGANTAFHETRFQINLLYIQNQFEKAFSDLKIKCNHLLFIDGIDIRPGSIPYEDYLDCIKGLANAIWDLNCDFFSNIKDSKGRFRAIALLRPDIFNSLNLQNSTNKIRDNSVFLDWRTTYPEHRASEIFILCDRLLNAQQDGSIPMGVTWDYYFPWKSPSTSPEREFDPSFYKFLRLSYSRPRDIITMMQLIQEIFLSKNRIETQSFYESDFDSDSFQNQYSQYLMGGIRDQLSFYYTIDDYELFLKFFQYLNGKMDFTYDEYLVTYKDFSDYVYHNFKDTIPEFVETADKFLQFLYDTNIICYIEDLETEPLFRFCYRERSISNISPKVKYGVRYRIHYGLAKELNVGMKRMK